MGDDLTLPLAAESLLPHRLPMRLLDRLLEYSDGRGTAEARLPVDCPFAGADGVIHPAALVELMAQGYAAMKGYDDRLRRLPVKEGFLVGVRAASFPGTAYAGDLLQVRLRRLGSIEGFILASADVLRGEEILASGTIKLWVPPDGPAAGGPR